MVAMVQCTNAGFEADDPMREYIHEAAGRIADTLERDFKPYVGDLLKDVFKVIGQRPQEVDPDELPDEDDDEEERDMSLLLVGDKVMGLKTTVLEEMKEALVLIKCLLDALKDDYCEFLPETCKNLAPLLEFPLPEEVCDQAFKTWEALVECARTAVDCGKWDKTMLRELVGHFLKKALEAMAQAPKGEKLDEPALAQLQAL